MADAKNIGWIGTQFVHRIYEESHVRIRLVSGVEADDTDKVVYCAVDVRMGDPDKVGDCSYWSNVVGPNQFNSASDHFKAVVMNYVNRGVLPK